VPQAQEKGESKVQKKRSLLSIALFITFIVVLVIFVGMFIWAILDPDNAIWEGAKAASTLTASVNQLVGAWLA
jgi:membrane protein YdbS with pleckstrin-like domain